MAASLAIFESKADGVRDAEHALVDAQVAVARVKDTVVLWFASAPTDTDTRFPVLARSQVSDAAAAIDRLAHQSATSDVVAPLERSFDRYRSLLETALALEERGLATAAREAIVSTAAPAFEALDQNLKNVASTIRIRDTTIEATKDHGTIWTLVIGGCLLFFLTLLTSRAHRRLAVNRAEADAVQRSERRFQSLIANSSDLTTVLDEEGRVTFQSSSIEALLGLSAADVVGRSIGEFLHSEDAAGLPAFLERASRRPGVRTTTDWRLRRRTGELLDVEAIAIARFGDQDIDGILISIRDVSERRRLEDALRHQAFHDPLTGLANRALFQDRIEHGLGRTARSRRSICVMLIDLDNFKEVNDSFGHALGDQVLLEVATRLSSSLREEDTIARLGGDEFAVLIEEADGEEGATRVARRLLASVAEPLSAGWSDVALGVSIGIAFGSAAPGDRAQHATHAGQILVDADLAMYEAKSKGKGQYCFYSSRMHDAARERAALRSELDRALREGEFVLHYQPIVAIGTGAIVGAEALVRWQHPERGLVPPMQFIPFAEETGLILDLGAWVLRDACAEAVLWPEPKVGPPAFVSVNVAGSQLQQSGFTDEISRVLGDTGLDPGRLTLELTESALISDDTIEPKLRTLRAMGVRIAVDDFGTGYSSLTYLRKFTLDALKIDKAFVDELGTTSKGSALVAAMVGIADNLGMGVVAEGIEELSQLEDLRALGCEFGQGFLFSRPVPASELVALLAARTGVREDHGAPVAVA